MVQSLRSEGMGDSIYWMKADYMPDTMLATSHA